MTIWYFLKGISEDTIPVKLKGKPESQFGLSLSSIGDLNRDGYPGMTLIIILLLFLKICMHWLHRI